jgi:hypothetical protein
MHLTDFLDLPAGGRGARACRRLLNFDPFSAHLSQGHASALYRVVGELRAVQGARLEFTACAGGSGQAAPAGANGHASAGAGAGAGAVAGAVEGATPPAPLQSSLGHWLTVAVLDTAPWHPAPALCDFALSGFDLAAALSAPARRR